MFWTLLTGLLGIHEQIDTENKIRKHQPEAQKTIQRWNEDSKKLQAIKDKVKAIGSETSSK